MEEVKATPTGKMVWFDFQTKDEVKAMAFFKSVFAWEFDLMSPNYWAIKAGGEGMGGLSKEGNFKPVAGFVPYFNVPSVLEAKGLVEKNGGKLVGDIVAIAEGTHGYFQNFTDLDGNTLALWSMKK